MHNGSAPCGIEELTYLWCHCIRWKNPITKYFELTTWSIWCTSFISWEAAIVTTHLSDINSKSTTCSEESTAIPSFWHIGSFPVDSCRGGKKSFTPLLTYYKQLETHACQCLKLTWGTAKSHCRSKFLAFAKISVFFLDAKCTSTFSAKLLNLASLLSDAEMNIISFKAASNSEVWLIIFWKSASFDASSGTTWIKR